MAWARIVSTGAAVAAVVVAGGVVVGMAGALPHGTQHVDSLSSAASTSAVGSDAPTYPVYGTSATTPRTVPAPSTSAKATPTRAAAATGTPATAPPSSVARPSAPVATSTPTTRAVAAPPAAAPVRGQALPLGYSTGNATRVITVTAGNTGSTTATLQAWNAAPGGGWLRYGGAITAHIGSQGMTTTPSESESATPMGSFTLTQAFGWNSNPGTGLPYIHTDPASWWISTEGPQYNTYQHCSSCGYGSPDEQLSTVTQYGYAVVIDYNRSSPRAYGGSAFFLHISDGGPTAGCVSIPQGNLTAIMQWLTPSTHPRILIGTG